MLADRPPVKSAPKVPCARCGATSSAWAWGHPLCEGCWGEWLKDSRFSAGEVQRALGQTDRPEDSSTEWLERYKVEATRRTAAWVKEVRRG